MKKLISSILFILITISSVLLLCIFSANKFISEDSLKATIEKIDVPAVILNDQGINDNVVMQNNDGDRQILEEVYEIAARVNVTREEVNHVINSNAIKDFTAMYVSKIANYVTTGDESRVTGSDIAKVVKDNIDIVADEVGVKLNDNSKNAIITAVDTYADDIATLIPEPKVIAGDDSQELIIIIQKIFSNQTKIILFSVLGVSCLLLVLIQLKNYRFMKWISLAFMLSGVITCIFGYSLVSTLGYVLADLDRVVLDLIKIVANDLKMTFFINGGVVIGVSLVVLLIYEAINRKLHDKELDDLATKIEAEYKEN